MKVLVMLTFLYWTIFLLPPGLGDDDGVSNVGREHKMELEHVQINHEVETMILDQIDRRLADLEDINVDAKILERHLDKHPNFTDYRSTKNTLNDIEEKILQPYKMELNLMKRKIIASNHDLEGKYVKEINKMLDNAQITVDNGRDMIDSFIDVHVESSEHQHEHDHGEGDEEHDHGDHDNLADYSDLITEETEATQEEEKLIIDSLQREIEDLDNVKIYKADLEGHLKEHKFREDEVDTKFAESVLDEVRDNDIEDYKTSLLELKRQIGEANGSVQLDFVDKVVSALDRANIFVEISRNRLEIADQLDADAANLVDKDDNGESLVLDEESAFLERLSKEGNTENVSPSPSNEVDEDIQEFRKAADSVRQVIEQSEAVKDRNNVKETENVDAAVQDSAIRKFLDDNYFSLLTIVCVLFILILITLVRFSPFQEANDPKSDKFHEIGGICSPQQEERSIYNFNYTKFDEPKVVDVKEAKQQLKGKSKPVKDGEWKNRNWNPEQYDTPYKRK